MVKAELTLTKRSNTIRGIIAGLCIPMMHSPFSIFAIRLLASVSRCLKVEDVGPPDLQDEVGHDHNAISP